MNHFGSLDQELESNDICVVCDYPCIPHLLTGDRRRITCIACYENGDYDKYLKRHPELSETETVVSDQAWVAGTPTHRKS